MVDCSGIIYAYQIREGGEAKSLLPIRLDSYGLPTSGITANEDASARINAALAGSDLTWVHLDINEASSKKWVDAELTFLDPLTLDALFAEETRPRILEFDTGTLLILRSVNLNADAEPEDMVSIRRWIDSSRIISVRKRRLKAVTDLRESIEAGVGPHNAGDFITQLTSRLFERMEPVFTKLDELLDDAEERVIEAADTKYRSQITDIRK